MRGRIGAAALALLAACAPGEPDDTPGSAPPSTTAAPATSAPTTAASPTTTATAFRSTVKDIDAATATRMATSWRAGCPVGLEDLRYVTVSHWGFDGQVHDGELVLHADVADAIVTVFAALFEARFPLEQVRLVDDFAGDDDRSMAANNTSAFNCRQATGSSRWSEHAYGKAIDLNPIQNPFVTARGTVLPPEGAPYADRHAAPGVIQAGDAVVAAFGSIGWTWGGTWTSGKDYQHFSASGR